MVKMRKNNVEPPPAECPLSGCMKFIRGAWSSHIIWYLTENPRRFSELKADIKGVSAKVLSGRLKEMEEIGVIYRQVMDTSPPTVEYSLTELGRELQPAIVAIVKVGHKLKQKKLTEI
ncbi:MAG: helix-turn-helix domain-containing protein [Pseudomonadota bacterium]